MSGVPSEFTSGLHTAIGVCFRLSLRCDSGCRVWVENHFHNRVRLGYSGATRRSEIATSRKRMLVGRKYHFPKPDPFQDLAMLIDLRDEANAFNRTGVASDETLQKLSYFFVAESTTAGAAKLRFVKPSRRLLDLGAAFLADGRNDNLVERPTGSQRPQGVADVCADKPVDVPKGSTRWLMQSSRGGGRIKWDHQQPAV